MVFNRPQLRSGFQPQLIEPDIIFLLTENQTFILQDSLCKHLIPYLNGVHDVDQIIAALGEQFPAEEILYRILELEQRGYLQDAEQQDEIADLPCSSLKFDLHILDPLRTDPRAAQVIDHLQHRLGSQLSSEADLKLVVTDDYLRPDLEQINQTALESQQVWMLIKPVGQVIWLGPIFQPRHTGCWHCLAQRLRGQRLVESFLQYQLGIPIYRPWQLQISTSQLAVEWLMGSLGLWGKLYGTHPQDHPLWGKLLTWDQSSLKTEEHVLIRRPQCLACGDPQLRDLARSPQPMSLSDPKSMPLSSEKFLERYEHHLDPYLGLVQEIRSLPPLDHPLIYNTQVVHPFVIRDSLGVLQSSLQGISRGKGRSRSEARAKGVAEALERYSGLSHGDESRVLARYEDLEEKAIHPDHVLLFSSQQYRNRAHLNSATHDPRHQIPDPLDPQEPIDWTPLWSLTEQVFKFLPTAYCYYGYPDLRYGQADSNGCAAGSCLEQAILNGFLELVERDGIALWWYNRLRKPAIDLTSFPDPYIQDLQTDYQQQGWNLWVLDLTTDLQIPICAAVAVPQDPQCPGFICGFGAHLDPGHALIQALTELNQIRASLPAPGDLKISSDPHAPWWQTQSMTQLPYLRPHINYPAKALTDYPPFPSRSLREELSICLESAQQQGLEILVLDQTRPDVGLPVVRVVVPGLRHFWRRLAPGRLYTVPVHLGWLPAPLTEDQLNPHSLSF